MTLLRLSLPLLLLGCTLARADADISVTVMPMFPAGLDYEGYRAGDADVAIEVDSTGKLADCLVTACTRKQFGEEALRAARQWRYKAGLVDGQPGGWVRHITVHFETTGIKVVSDDAFKPIILGMPDEREDATLYRAYSPKELDRIPPFTHFVAPQGAHAGVVTVEFYVDETGAVRLPAVRTPADPDLESAALKAVSQWHFAPPLRKNAPVLLKVRQDLRFVGKKA